MKAVVPSAKSIHEILGILGNASMLAGMCGGSPLAYWGAILSGLGLAASSILSGLKENATLAEVIDRIEELAAQNDASLSQGIIAQPAAMALAFDQIVGMKHLPATAMPLDDIRRPWLLLTEWLDEKFKATHSAAEGAESVARSIREGLDTRLAILTAEQKEFFNRQSQELAEHWNSSLAIISPKLDKISTDQHQFENNSVERHQQAEISADKRHEETLSSIAGRIFYTTPPDKFCHLPLPRASNLFTGREDDLRQISSAHFNDSYRSSSAPLVLHGPPGVGKTSLACELLYRLRDQGTLSHVFYITAADPAALPSLFAHLAVTLGLVSSAIGPVDSATAHSALVHWLAEAAPAGKVLFYFDNADAFNSRSAVLAEIKSLGHPRSLITSRLGGWPRCSHYPVPLWSDSQAWEFLTKRLPSVAAKDAELLIDALGGLPIAFELASALIDTRHYSVTELLGRWRTKLAAEKIPDRNGEETVAALLAVSLDGLGETPRNLLQILSHFAPQPIPELWLSSVEGDDWRDDLSTLEQSSLLIWLGSDKTIFLHPFLRSAIFQSISQEDRETFFAIAVALILVHLPSPNWSPDHREVWSIFLPHVAALAANSRDRVITEIATPCFAASFASLLNQSGGYLYNSAEYQLAEPLMRDALRIDRAVHGEDHPLVAARLSNLAALLQATNRLSEAEPLIRNALRIDRATYEGDHPDIAIRLNNLATLLQASNRLAEAELLMRETLRIDRAVYGDDHPEVAIDLNNLAQLLRETDHFLEAEILMQDALRIDRAVYGDDHPTVAVRLNNLAVLFQTTNRPHKAEPLIRDAMRIDLAAYGGNHPRVATRLSNLAALLQDTDRSSEAEPLLREALRIFYGSLGPEHPTTEVVSNTLEALVVELKTGSQ